MNSDPLSTALQPVVAALEELDVRYYIGGSVAGMAHGEYRQTADVDIIAELGLEHVAPLALEHVAPLALEHVAPLALEHVAPLALEHVAPLAQALQSAYYVDEIMIRDAVAQRTSFNVLHLEVFFKVDVFGMRGRAYDFESLRRRMREFIASEPPVEAFVATAEDTLLAKLELFRMGGEFADRQWRDIMGICKVQREELDFDYLYRWAREPRVADLLGRALEESGLGNHKGNI